MKKPFYLVGLAALALVGCSDNDFFGDGIGTEAAKQGNGEISFAANGSKVLRGETLEGAQAAAKLGNQFMVYGYKSGENHAEAESAYAADKLSAVFPFYRVNYVEGSAYTTETNSHSWEYVGSGDAYVTNPASVNGVAASEPVNQSIKYWDWSAQHYDYLAWAIKDPNAATMESLRTDNTANNLTFTASSPDDLANIYVANRVTIENTTSPTNPKGQEGQNYTSEDANKYGNYVQFQFRNLACKIRLGIYETIPGYSVSDVNFYYDGTNLMDDAQEAGATEQTAVLYGGNNIIRSGSVGVKYKDYHNLNASDATEEQKVNSNVAYATTSANETGSFISFKEFVGKEKAEYKEAGNKYIGRTSNTATYAIGKGAEEFNYVYAFPTSAGDLNLKVDYTLTAVDGSGETIKVTGANAVVPAGFNNWLANYAYTYLFKISQNTNGNTGGSTSPVGLYPITFDALVVDMDEKVQETITSLSREGSITTYQKGKVVTENDEYVVKTDATTTTLTEPISIVCKNGVALNATNFKLYIVNNHSTETLTEETVANYVNNGVVLTKLVPGTFSRDPETLQVTRTGDYAIRNAYAGADGNDVTVGTNMVADFEPKAGYTYVAEFIEGGVSSYKIIKIADKASNEYTYAISTAPTVTVGDATGATFTLTGSTSDYGDDRVVLGAAKAFPISKGVSIVSAANSNSYTVKATADALGTDETTKSIDLNITGATVTNKTLTVNGFGLADISVAPGTTGIATMTKGGSAAIPTDVTNFKNNSGNKVKADAIDGSNVTVSVAAKTPAGTYDVTYENAVAKVTVVPYQIKSNTPIINQPTSETATITLSNTVTGASSNKDITVTGEANVASAASYTTNTDASATSHTATFTGGTKSGIVTLSHDAAECQVEVTHFRIKAAKAIKHDKSGLDLTSGVIDSEATNIAEEKIYVCFTSDAEYADGSTTGRQSVKLATTGTGASIKSVGSTGLYELTLATDEATTVTYTYKGKVITLWKGSK